MYTLLILLCTGIAALKQDNLYSITALNNSGVLFEDLGSIWPYSYTWTIFIEMDLNELDNQITLADQAELLLKKLCNESNSCYVQQLYIQKALDNIKSRTHTIKLMNPKAKTTRSLFNGIGNALHYLFGTMDNNNEEEVYSRLSKLELNEKTLADLEEQQISIVNSTWQQMQKPLHELMLEQTRVSNVIQNLQELTNGLAKFQLRQEILNGILLQIMEIESRQRTFLDVITAAQNNQIHPLLISADSILEIYQKTHPQCKECLSMLRQTAQVKTHIFQDKLVVKIQLPVFHLPKMAYYQIHHYPVHSNEGISTVLDIKYSFIAVNYQNLHVILLTSKDNDKVKHITKYKSESTYVFHPETTMIRADNSTECVVKLLINPRKEKINCPTRVQTTPQDVLIKMNRPNCWIFSIQKPLTIYIVNPPHSTTTQIENEGILEIKQLCHIQISDRIIPFENTPFHPLNIIQPPYFPSLENFTIYQDIINNYKATQNSTDQLQSPLLIIGDKANEIIQHGTSSLAEIRDKLIHLKHNNTRILTVTSLSFTSMLIGSVLIYLLIKIFKRKDTPRPQVIELNTINPSPITHIPTNTLPRTIKLSTLNDPHIQSSMNSIQLF